MIQTSKRLAIFYRLIPFILFACIPMHANAKLVSNKVTAKIYMDYDPVSQMYFVKKAQRDPFLSSIINAGNISNFNYSHLATFNGELEAAFPNAESKKSPGVVRLESRRVPPQRLNFLHESGVFSINAKLIPKGLDFKLNNTHHEPLFGDYLKTPKSAFTYSSDFKSYGGIFGKSGGHLTFALFQKTLDDLGLDKFNVIGGAFGIAYDLNISSSHSLIKAGEYKFNGMVDFGMALFTPYAGSHLINFDITLVIPPVISAYSPIKYIPFEFNANQISATRQVPIIIDANYDTIKVVMKCESGMEKGKAGCLIPSEDKTNKLQVSIDIDGKVIENYSGSPVKLDVNYLVSNVKQATLLVRDENNTGKRPKPGLYSGQVSLVFEIDI